MDRSDVYNDGQHFTPGKVMVDLKFTAGASGAVPTTRAGFSLINGISGVVKSGNNYVVTLQDRYVKLVNWFGDITQASYSASGAFEFKVTAVDLTAKTITLSPCTAAGAAIALASGDILHCTFVLTRLQGNY